MRWWRASSQDLKRWLRGSCWCDWAWTASAVDLLLRMRFLGGCLFVMKQVKRTDYLFYKYSCAATPPRLGHLNFSSLMIKKTRVN
jgi:hypothetical protein